jgi:hypothetical protein
MSEFRSYIGLGVPVIRWEKYEYSCCFQGDQIRRFFAYWAIVYFVQFEKIENYLSFYFPNQKFYVLIFDKNGLGYILAHFFLKLIRSPWLLCTSLKPRGMASLFTIGK